MATAHGSAARLYVGGFDLTGYMREGGPSFNVDAAETTVWGLQSKTYIAGKSDATFSGGGIFDADMAPGLANRADDVLAPALGAAAPAVHLPQGDALGSPCFIIDGIESTYEITSPFDDVTSFSLELQSNSGSAVGRVLRPTTGTLGITAGGNGTNVDDQAFLATPAATTFGGIGVLQVINKGGGAGTLTVTIESSVNGSTGWATIASFAGVTAKNVGQVVTVAPGVTINRYLRAVWALTGGTWDIFVGFSRRQS